MDTKRCVARALLEIGAVGFSPAAPITFKSGIRSPVYVDNRSLVYHPAAWQLVIQGFAGLVQSRGLRYELMAGVALGGVPHCSALAYTLGRPSVFIRKASKGHGKGQRIEGGAVAGRAALLVEDLVTTGGSSLSAVEALREAGANVSDVIAIISYGFDEAAQAFERAGLRLHTLTDFAAVLEAARARQRLDESQIAVIERWLADPHNWRQRP